MSNTPTPHIDAKPGDFGKVVLMPGDPLRARFIAEHFLENPVLVNNVRGIQGYTGSYKGVKVSVMASGMGMPSMGIYSYELFHYFDVDYIMRIGSAGAYKEEVKVRDIVLGQGACYDSNYASQFHLPGTFSAISSYRMLKTCEETAQELGLRHHVGNLVSSDMFYADTAGVPEGMTAIPSWSKMGVLAVEMEAAALYMNAARAGKHALAICTISDHLLTGECTTAAERQETFTDMMTLALETARKLVG